MPEKSNEQQLREFVKSLKDCVPLRELGNKDLAAVVVSITRRAGYLLEALYEEERMPVSSTPWIDSLPSPEACCRRGFVFPRETA